MVVRYELRPFKGSAGSRGCSPCLPMQGTSCLRYCMDRSQCKQRCQCSCFTRAKRLECVLAGTAASKCEVGDVPKPSPVTLADGVPASIRPARMHTFARPIHSWPGRFRLFMASAVQALHGQGGSGSSWPGRFRLFLAVSVTALLHYSS